MTQPETVPMSQYETVIVERDGAVATVLINRPDAYNSFNAALRRDLLAAVLKTLQLNSLVLRSTTFS